MYEPGLLPREDGRPLVGLALGSGAARGWSHIGVLQALRREGVEIDVVCGCSIGALVGAAYASGRLDPLSRWVRGLSWQDVLSLLDISLRGGLIRGERVLQYCAEYFFAKDFSALDKPFACVATELSSGHELWLRDGSIADAVRASVALPGLFSPVVRSGRVLVDGGLVNPVPVSLCRALGAEIVIAVELGSGLSWRPRAGLDANGIRLEEGLTRRILGSMGLRSAGSIERAVDQPALPSLTDVVASSINIMQMRIARSRLAGEPADVLISPRVAQLNIMDFHRAGEAIKEGEAAVERARPFLAQALGWHVEGDDA